MQSTDFIHGLHTYPVCGSEWIWKETVLSNEKYKQDALWEAQDPGCVECDQYLGVKKIGISWPLQLWFLRFFYLLKSVPQIYENVIVGVGFFDSLISF